MSNLLSAPEPKLSLKMYENNIHLMISRATVVGPNNLTLNVIIELCKL